MNNKKIVIISSIVAVTIGIILIFILTNKPTYNIKFDTNGGNLIEEQLVKKGDKVIQPHDPIKDGYAFAEWTYEGTTYNFSKEVTSDLTLVAKWIKIETNTQKIIIKFNTDGGSTISNQILEKGDFVIKPADPTKKGYKFAGWLLNEKPYDFKTPVDEKIELKAKWEKVEETKKPNNSSSNNTTTNNNKPTTNNNNTKPSTPSTPTVKKYTVTFNSNGGTAVASQTITEGGKVTKPQNPTRNGYTFAGWLLGSSVYDFNTPVKANMQLIAKWNENEKAKYTVSFDSNGGTSVSAQTVTEGNRASRPQDPTRNGYNFAGWTLNNNNYDFNSSIKSNITLVAKWNQKSYTIRMSAVDDQSPDRNLTVYEEGIALSSDDIQEIKLNGYTLCYGSNMTVNKYELKSGNTVTIILTGGVSVTATVL